jgi:hypothetical protein
MNKAQKAVIIIIALLIVGMMLYPPFRDSSSPCGYHFILESEISCWVNTSLLCMQFFVALILGGALFFVLKSKE